MQRVPAHPEAAATMQQVAASLGISIATVSRALRRMPGINPRTRARVFEAAARLGYSAPKSYRTQHLENTSVPQVGVIVNAAAGQTPVSYLVGLSDACVSLNAALSMHYAPADRMHDLLSPERLPPMLKENLLAGLIFIYRWPAEIIRTWSERLPCVSIMHSYPGIGIDVVGIDHFGGMECLLGHLAALGHRRIGFFGRCREIHWASERYGAYASLLLNLGLELRADWAVEMEAEALLHQTRPWDDALDRAAQLTKKSGVTAWVCSAETVAARLRAFLLARGFDVPGDVSITGFHRPDFLPPSEDAITSVTASYASIGAATLQRLLHRVRNPAQTPRLVLFPCALFRGTTTAPPRRRREDGVPQFHPPSARLITPR